MKRKIFIVRWILLMNNQYLEVMDIIFMIILTTSKFESLFHIFSKILVPKEPE